jgi:hypothetical protein
MLSFKLIRQMMRTILFIVYDIVFHIERKINYFILFIYLFYEVYSMYNIDDKAPCGIIRDRHREESSGPQSRQSTRLFHQSSKMVPPPPTRKGGCPPSPLVPGTHSLAEGGGSQFRRGGTDTRVIRSAGGGSG